MALAQFLPDRDPRTAGWFGYAEWKMLVYIIGIYVGVVKLLLPQYMASRKEYKLLGLIRVYNLILILINVVFLYNLATRTYFGGGYNWLCQGLRRESPDLSVLQLHYSYTFLRIFEFLDTVFFVLRKKYSQANVLHISHHCIAIILPWYGLVYGIDGQICGMVVFNMTEQILMYTYYFLASFPFFRPYLGWKRYLTIFQIVQFAAVGIHMAVPLFYECGYPAQNSLLVVAAYVYFLLMFRVFYASTYQKRTSRTGGKTQDNSHIDEFARSLDETESLLKVA